MTRGIPLYNSHLRGPVKLTPIAKRLAVELSLPLLGPSQLRFEQQPSAWEAYALTHYATAAANALRKYIKYTLKKQNSHLSNAENDRCIWLVCAHERRVRQLPPHMYLYGRPISVFHRCLCEGFARYLENFRH